MPTLKQITCSVELGSKNTKLDEYGHFYSDGLVECFIPVPDTHTPFHLHVQSDGYIAPGLAAFVFIDGTYQCNRNRLNLGLPDDRTKKEQNEIDFVMRQKEEKIKSGEFIGREWTFATLNTDQADKGEPISTRFLKNVGTIEVVILRCNADHGRHVPSHVGDHLFLYDVPRRKDQQQLDKPPVASVRQTSTRHSSAVAPAPSHTVKSKSVTSTASPLGGLAGLFDGVCDDDAPRGDDPAVQPVRVVDEQEGVHMRSSNEPHHQDPCSLPSDPAEEAFGVVGDQSLQIDSYNDEQQHAVANGRGVQGPTNPEQESYIDQQGQAMQEQKHSSREPADRIPEDRSVHRYQKIPQGYDGYADYPGQHGQTLSQPYPTSFRAGSFGYGAQDSQAHYTRHVQYLCDELAGLNSQLLNVNSRRHLALQTMAEARSDRPVFAGVNMDWLNQELNRIDFERQSLENKVWYVRQQIDRHHRAETQAHAAQAGRYNSGQKIQDPVTSPGGRGSRQDVADHGGGNGSASRKHGPECAEMDSRGAQKGGNDGSGAVESRRDRKPSQSSSRTVEWVQGAHSIGGDQHQNISPSNGPAQDGQNADDGDGNNDRWATNNAQNHQTKDDNNRWDNNDWNNKEGDLNDKGNHQNEWEDKNNNPQSSNHGWHDENRRSSHSKDASNCDQPDTKSHRPAAAADGNGHTSNAPRSYYADWRKPSTTQQQSSSANNANGRKEPRAAYDYAARPIPAVPAAPAEDDPKAASHGVQAGQGARYVHRCHRPDYLDEMTKPYAIFRFKYRSPAALEKILKRRIDLTPFLERVRRSSLENLSKEKLIQLVLDKSRGARPSDGDAASTPTTKRGSPKGDGGWPDVEGPGKSGGWDVDREAHHPPAPNDEQAHRSKDGWGNSAADKNTKAASQRNGGNRDAATTPKARAGARAGDRRTSGEAPAGKSPTAAGPAQDPQWTPMGQGVTGEEGVRGNSIVW